MNKDNVQTNVSLPAPVATAAAPEAGRVKPPNYMVFVCSLDRADKAARKSPASLERFGALRTGAIAAYKAKDYARAVELHNEAHRAAKGEEAPPTAQATQDAAAANVAAVVANGAEVVAAAGSPRPPKAGKAKKAAAPKAAPKKATAPVPAKAPAPKTKPEKAAKPAKVVEADAPQKLSALGAAAQVLAASKEPLNVKAIVAEMGAQGLWTSPGGKTPHSTLAAAIQRDIAAKGRDSRFKKADKGLYAASGSGA